MKVVILPDHGGFSLSVEAARYMAERGHEAAFEELYRYDGKMSGNIPLSDFENRFGVAWYGFFCDASEHRSNPILVEAVEVLGDKAGARHAELKVVEIPDGTDYIVMEYDGAEWIAERHRTWS